MAKDQIQSVETEEVVKGHTVLSFTHPTPMWATWAFRTEFILNKAAMMWLGGTALIPPEKVKETVLILTIVDFVVWFVARGLGVKKPVVDNP